MGDLELIGKIIAQNFFDASDFTAAEQIDSLTDTVITSSDNAIFNGHKVMIESRWVDAPIYSSTSTNQFQMDLQIPATLISLLMNFFHFRSIPFPSLDDALDLFLFATKISNQQLQKVCLDGIKEKMSPPDVVKIWKHSKALRQHKSIIDYVSYHFPSMFGESEDVRNEFKTMPLNVTLQLLKLRKLNIQSEKDLVPIVMFYIQENKRDGNEMLKIVNNFIECFRIQKDRAKYVLPHLTALNTFNIDTVCKGPSFNLARRIPRDLFIFFGLYNKRNPIAWYVDLETKRFCRMSTLDNNTDFCVTVPNFCVSNGTLHQIGGNTSQSTSGFAKADCFSLDKETLKWQRKSSILHERAYSSVCASPNGRIFVIGGHSLLPRSRMKNVDVYDPFKNTWKSGPKMLIGRYNAGSVFYGENLYVTGGATDDRSIEDCEYLPKYSENWVLMPQLIHARSAHQTVIFGKHLYVLGGRNGNDELSSVERLEYGTNGTWKEVAPMSVKRSNFAAAVWDDKLFVFGGEKNGVEQTVEYFDGEKWNSFCSLPSDHTPLAALNWKNVPHAEKLIKNDGIDSMIFATIDEEEEEGQICANNNCCMGGGAVQGA